MDNIYGEIKETGRTEIIYGVTCEIVKAHYPVDTTDGNWRWYTAYRFTVPGWKECTITGLEATKRVIRGRTSSAVRNTLNKPY